MYAWKVQSNGITCVDSIVYRNGNDRIVRSGEMMITCVRKPIGLFYKVVVEITFNELSVCVHNVQCIVLHGKGISKALKLKQMG